MEKLKVKHDHKLTDILKVFIFTLFLLIPGIMFIPSMLYFGFNHEANAPVKQVQIQENIKLNYNQIINDNFNNYNNNGLTFEAVNNYQIVINGTSTSQIGSGSVGINFTNSYYNFLRDGRKYLVRFDDLPNGFYLGVSGYAITNNKSFIFSQVNSTSWNGFIRFQCEPNVTFNNFTVNLNIYDLTTMYGVGNEPSIADFELQFPYYSDYTESQEIILTIEKETEQVVDITTQLEWNWEQIWQTPILSWTNFTILKQGLDAFTNVFGVLQTSYITNLIAYELIIVAIYIVIDIVLTLFKWLTHMVGSKE